MSRILCVWPLVLLICAGSFADAQNLLANPTFDNAMQISGWYCDSVWGVPSWSTQDIVGDPMSGSMEHNLAVVGNDHTTVTCTQCVPVTEHLPYIISGWAFWPDDPDVHQIGTTRFAFGFYANPDCTSSLGPNEVVVGTPTLDSWFEVVSDEYFAPAGATSANILVVTWQNTSGMPVRARLDNLDFSSYLSIFSDGFETGDLLRWSTHQD